MSADDLDSEAFMIEDCIESSSYLTALDSIQSALASGIDNRKFKDKFQDAKDNIENGEYYDAVVDMETVEAKIQIDYLEKND